MMSWKQRGERARPVGDEHIDFRMGTFLGPVIGKVEYHDVPPAPTAMAASPAAPAVFTGRDAVVADLLSALRPGSEPHRDAAVICAVAGMGGVGKTALALYVAHVAREHGWFPGGTLFIDMRGYDDVPVTADQAVLSLLRALGIRDSDLPPTADGARALYRSALDRREPVLLVLDNVSDPTRIPPLLPGRAWHRVLVTSRSVLHSLPLRQFTIDALAPDAAHTLLDRSLRLTDSQDARVSREPAAARELAELCGHLPLALLIAVALLRLGKPRPVAALTAKLRRAVDRVRSLHTDGVDQYGKELALRPVFEVMYRRLGPELARLFRLLGQCPGEDIGIGPAAELSGLPLGELEPLLDKLSAASVISPAVDGGRWQMHDLVRHFARTVVAENPTLQKEGAEARHRLLVYYVHGTLSASAHIQEMGSHDVPDLFSGSRAAALDWLDSERYSLLGAALWAESEDVKQAQLAMFLPLLLDGYLHLRHAYADWTTVARVACAAAHRLDAPEVEANALDCLGQALRGLRRYEEAVESHERAQRIYEQLGDRQGQAKAWNGLGLALLNLRRCDEAAEACARSVRIYRELGDGGREATARANMGAALEALDRLDEAHEAFTRALETYIALGDRRGEANTRDSLGLTLRRLGRAKDATDAHTRALGLNAELGDWHNRATAWNNLGLALQDLGRYDDAIACHARARGWYAFFRDAHSEAAAWLYLGKALSDLRRCEETLEALQQAQDLYRACDDWYSVGVCLSNTARTHSAQRRFPEARQTWAKAAEAFERASAREEAEEARRNAQAFGEQ